jgi:hypothetical protein
MPKVSADRRRHRRARVTTVVAAMLLAIGLMSQLGAEAATASVAAGLGGRLVEVTPAPRLPGGAHAVGAVLSSVQVSGVVALKPRDEQAVTGFIEAVTNPRSPLYRQYLAKGQYASRFGPSPASVAAVRQVLVADGLTVTSVSSNNLLVDFRGSASRVESAFHTGLERVRLSDGTMGQATTSNVRLPASIAASVQAVLGLDDLVHEHSSLDRFGPARAASAAVSSSPAGAGNGGPVACPAAQELEATEGALTDQQVADSYGVGTLYSGGDLGGGQTVDVYELEPFAMSDVATFDECYFGASHTSNITVTLVDGGPGTGPGSGEAALDVEDVSALASDAHIHVFSGANMNNAFGPLDTWNAIAVADDARQVTSSWGLCEEALQVGAPGTQQVENEIFQQTAAQGQSVFAASGDDGSDDCANHASTPTPADLSVDDPGSQPYVVSVGGTTILQASQPPVETVWDNGTEGGAGGGGISETWAMPSWQAGFITSDEEANEACSNDPTGVADDSHLAGDPTDLPSGTPCRQAPDVSALADPQSGITIYQGGQWFPIGGTSSATPLWAAMTAEINASTACSGATFGVGFVDPLLYQVASAAGAYAEAFNDITVGNNDNLGVGDGTMYSAGTGYDLASGLGTPRITNSNGDPGLDQLLCAAVTTGALAVPAVTSLSSTAGPISGGGTLTIDGANFGSAQGRVYFGNVAATVTAWGASAITVDVPAYEQPPGTTGSAGGSADVIVTTDASPPESSSPGAASVYHFVGGASASPVPVVDYVGPVAGPEAGGTTGSPTGSVSIVGSGFEEAGGVTGVTFGGVAATGLHVIDDNELTVVPPAETLSTKCQGSTVGICQVQVVVSNGNGPSATDTILPAYSGPIVFQPSGAFVAPPGCGCEITPAPSEYDYAPAPTITSESPGYASELGGTTVAITGSGFNLLDFEWVNVGPIGPAGSEDFSLDGISATEIDITFPPDPNGLSVEPDPVDLSVQTAGGIASAPSSGPGSYAFAGVPVVTGLSKHLGAQADPGSLMITGSGFSDANLVVFVGQGSLNFLASTTTHFVVNSDDSITVSVPQFFAIPTDTLVCSATGCSATQPDVDTFLFAYPGRPVVTSASPASGPAHGGTVVSIVGTLDSEVTAVHFGTLPATIVNQPFAAPSGVVTVLAPIGPPGRKVDITITTAGGTLVGQPTSATTTAATFTFTTSTPSAPLDVVASAGTGSGTVKWQPPVTSGGDPITGYVLAAEPRHKGMKAVGLSASEAARSARFPQLTAGVTWVIVVIAKTALGRGLEAVSNPITPT